MPTTSTVFDSLSDYSPGTGGGLAGDAARQNIQASPDFERLVNLLTSINQNAYLNAPGRQQQLQNIQNKMAGNMDLSDIQGKQSAITNKYMGAGFGVDSEAMQSAARRALTIDRNALMAQGGQELNSMYSQMPVTNANDYALTPALLQKQQDDAAQRALQAQQIGDNAAQWQAQLQQRDKEFTGNIAQQQADLAARMGLSYAQMGEQAREFDVGESGKTTRLGLELAARAAEVEAGNTIKWAAMQQEQNQFTQNFGLQQNQFAESQRQYNESLAKQQNQFSQTFGEGQRQFDIGIQSKIDSANAAANATNYWDPRWTAFKSGESNLPAGSYGTPRDTFWDRRIT